MIRDDIFYLVVKLYAQKEKEFAEEHPGRYRCLQRYRQERIKRVAQYCVDHWSGDLIEIGAWEGYSTVMFAQIARDSGRRVIALDPWIPGRQNCEEESYNRFMEHTEPHQDVIDVVRLGSEEPEAIAYIKARELCFAYVDGMHQHDYVVRDIQTVAHCNGIICCDDVDRLHYAGTGFWEGATLIGREVLYFPGYIEGYLLPVEVP